MVVPSVRDRRELHRNRDGASVKAGTHFTRAEDKEHFYSEKDLNYAFAAYYRSHKTEYRENTLIWDRSPALRKRNSLDGVIRKLRKYAANNPGRFKVSVQLSFCLYKLEQTTSNRNNRRRWIIHYASDNSTIPLDNVTPTGMRTIASTADLERTIADLSPTNSALRKAGNVREQGPTSLRS